MDSHYEKIKQIIAESKFSIVEIDLERPWGGFIRLENSDAEMFIDKYFPDVAFETFENLSPKFLLLAPGKRLSWQKHDRRSEVWRVIEGAVAIKMSETDDEPDEVTPLQKGEMVEFGLHTRHRGGGLNGWGIVAEIWQHADGDNLSDEADIVRISDDFGR